MNKPTAFSTKDDESLITAIVPATEILSVQQSFHFVRSVTCRELKILSVNVLF